MERCLATIMAADVVGSDLSDRLIAELAGRVFKTTGDGLLLEFASVVDGTT